MLTPEDILEQRIVTKGGHQITQFLVKWQALPPFFFFETGNVSWHIFPFSDKMPRASSNNVAEVYVLCQLGCTRNAEPEDEI